MTKHPVIIEVLDLLKTSNTPVIKVYKDNANIKILVIGMLKGVKMKKYKSNNKASILIKTGKVNYKSITTNKIFNIQDEHFIPAEELHAVESLDNSFFLLTTSK